MLGQGQQSHKSELLKAGPAETYNHAFFRARGQSPDTQLNLFTESLHPGTKHNKRNHTLEVNSQTRAIPTETHSRLEVCQANCQRAGARTPKHTLHFGKRRVLMTLHLPQRRQESESSLRFSKDFKESRVSSGKAIRQVLAISSISSSTSTLLNGIKFITTTSL